MANITTITPSEAVAIKSGSSRRDATYILRVLNRVCKSNNGNHYSISHTSNGWKVDCTYGRDKINEQMRGVVGTTTVITRVSQHCFSESRLCNNLRNELSKVVDLSSINL